VLTTNESYVTYQGNGATTSFPFSFIIPDSQSLVVSITNNTVSPPQTTVLASSQYSVTGLGSSNEFTSGAGTGGTVTYPNSGSSLPAGWSITIQRIVSYTQETSLTNQGAMYPQVIEAALDYLTMQTQQLAAAQSSGLSIESPATGSAMLPFFTPQQYGAKADGITDDAPAFAAAFAAAKGAPVLGVGCFYIGSQLTIPDGAHLVGAERDPGAVPSGAYNSTYFGSMLICNSTLADPIVHGCRCSIEGFLVINSLFMPLGAYPLPWPDATHALAGIGAFCDTAISPVSGRSSPIMDYRLENLLIIGFESAYDPSGVGAGGIQRALIRNVKGDCANGINIENCYDVPWVEDCEFWPFTTVNLNQSNFSYLVRTGTAFAVQGSGSSSWTTFLNCFEDGYQTGYLVNGVVHVRHINCGADAPNDGSTTRTGWTYTGGCGVCLNERPTGSLACGDSQIQINNTSAGQNCVAITGLDAFDALSSGNGHIHVIAGNYVITGSAFADNHAGDIKLESTAGYGLVSNNSFSDNINGAPVFGDAGAVSRCKFNGAVYSGTSGSGGSGNAGYTVQPGGSTQQEFGYQYWVLRIANTGGTLQHRITEMTEYSTPVYGSGINNPSATLENTPTGTDSTTALAYGGKISSGTSNEFVFDTPDQHNNVYGLAITATVIRNTTGTGVTVTPVANSININGVTANRLGLQFFSAGSGAGFTLNTTSIPVGDYIDIAVSGYLALTNLQ